MKFLSKNLQLFTYDHVVKVANPKLMNNVMAEISIPLPPLDIQEQIVREMEKVEKREEEIKSMVGKKR